MNGESKKSKEQPRPPAKPADTMKGKIDNIWKTVADLERGSVPNTIRNIAPRVGMTERQLYRFLWDNSNIKETLGIMNEQEYLLDKYRIAAEDILIERGEVTKASLIRKLGERPEAVFRFLTRLKAREPKVYEELGIVRGKGGRPQKQLDS